MLLSIVVNLLSSINGTPVRTAGRIAAAPSWRRHHLYWQHVYQISVGIYSMMCVRQRIARVYL